MSNGVGLTYNDVVQAYCWWGFLPAQEWRVKKVCRLRFLPAQEWRSVLEWRSLGGEQ